MSQPATNDSLHEYVRRAAAALDRHLPPADLPPRRLHEAMRYACLNGGKRIRAMLTYAAGSALRGSLDDLDVPASAVEMIHAYSLVHDDLPAMDDDDLRRGRPTCHIAYDEATAILAGDGLQTCAFETLASADSGIPGDNRLRMISVLANAIGSRGMAGGQMMDMAGESTSLGLEELRAVHGAKTGALITASVTLGALSVPDAGESTIRVLAEFGKQIGMAFQIVDDVLDETGDTATLGKPAGSDRQAGKSTYPAAVGLEQSRRLASRHHQAALSALEDVPGDTGDLAAIAALVVGRTF